MSKDVYVVIQEAFAPTNEAAVRRIQRGDEVPESQLALKRLAVGDRVKAADFPAVVIQSLLANRAVAPEDKAAEMNAALVLEYGPRREVSDATGQRAFVGVDVLSERAAALVEAALRSGGALPAWTEETLALPDDAPAPEAEVK